MATPAAIQLETILSARFPGIRFGRRNCRKISGSTQWSQHSWDNGRDIYPPLGLPNDWLDQVNEFLENHLSDLNVRVKLYRVKDHFNHIHVDFWPRGWSTPPCAGGTSQYRYPSGTVLSYPILLNTFKEDEMPRKLFEGMIYALFAADGEFQGNPQYWIDLIDNPNSPEWDNFWAAFTREIS